MRPSFLASALLAILVASGCSSAWRREPIYSKSGVALYREYRSVDEGKAPLGYLHPVAVDAQRIALILGGLTWKDSYFLGLKKPIDRTVFSPREVEAAAPALSLALGAIGPDERLRFLVTRSNWTEAFLGTQGTSGVIFCAKEGLLEIAFDRIQERMADDGGEPTQVTFDDPLEITSADPILPATAAVTLHIDPEEGIEYPRWVEVRLDQVHAVAAAPAGSPAAPGEKPSPAPAAPAPAAAGAETSPPPAPAGDPYQRVRERIERLKRLRADGVITEEEYAREFEKAISEL